jgi:hypothetical protein
MKYRRYIPPMIFILSIGLATYYLFIYSAIVDDAEKRTAGIIGLLGFGFGIFQFWVGEINNSRRRDFELTYEAYKELTLTIQNISEILNREMTGSHDIDPHGLVNSLMNLINQFQDTVETNDDFLFPGLQYKESFIRLTDITVNILTRTDKLRTEFETLENKGSEGNLYFEKVLIRMKWHNETREFLKELHANKYAFYKDVRKYL